MCIKEMEEFFVPEILPNKTGAPKHIGETPGEKKKGLMYRHQIVSKKHFLYSL